MPSFPVRKNHYTWPSFADDGGNFQPVLPSVLDPAIGDIKRPPPPHAKNSRGVCRLVRAIFGGASRTHFALRQIENSRPLSALRHLQQRAAAGLLYIVAVCGNCQYIERRR